MVVAEEVRPVNEPCERCGVLDALERHAPDCAYAISIGLPRLSEGEEPIDPTEEEAPTPEGPTPELIAQVVAPVVRTASPGLWLAYYVPEAPGLDPFSEAIVFPTELEALRFAVEHGMRATPLTLGKRLRDHLPKSES
jgi:hypothetical protein